MGGLELGKATGFLFCVPEHVGRLQIRIQIIIISFSIARLVRTRALPVRETLSLDQPSADKLALDFRWHPPKIETPDAAPLSPD